MSEWGAVFWARVKLSNSIVWMDVDTDLILFDRNQGSYSALNDVGARVWRCIAKRLSLSQTMDALADEFEGSPSDMEADVTEFVREAIRNGFLIEEKEP